VKTGFLLCSNFEKVWKYLKTKTRNQTPFLVFVVKIVKAKTKNRKWQAYQTGTMLAFNPNSPQHASVHGNQQLLL